MDAPVLISLARNHLGSDAPGVQSVWVSPRALAIQWMPRRTRGEAKAPWWVFLLNPAPELWRLEEADEAFKRLKAEARPDETRRWALELKGARLVDVEGDPRERWLGLIFQRRALSGRMEVTRLAYQAFPGRAGLRLDALDIASTRANSGGVRLGMGQPFANTPPEPEGEPPAFARLRERLGDQLEAALAGNLADILPGEGDLPARHRTWYLERAAKLLVNPQRQQADRKLVAERTRLVRLGAALGRDRAKHAAALLLKAQGAKLSA